MHAYIRMYNYLAMHMFSMIITYTCIPVRNRNTYYVMMLAGSPIISNKSKKKLYFLNIFLLYYF